MPYKKTGFIAVVKSDKKSLVTVLHQDGVPRTRSTAKQIKRLLQRSRKEKEMTNVEYAATFL